MFEKGQSLSYLSGLFQESLFRFVMLELGQADFFFSEKSDAAGKRGLNDGVRGSCWFDRC